ncbi:MAG: hypothetical protein IJO73_02390 [Clostridia bacterium]|nr:hypothetical protein [Clostridia bacterium]
MRIEDIEKTYIWRLFEKGRNYHRMRNVFTDTDRNYRMYNGDQWAGAKLGDVERVQINFIKPIVKYKLSVIHSNLYAINYSSQNFENPYFALKAEGYCKMLNRYAQKVWEQDKMDVKGRKVTKDAAINDEGIIFVDFDKKRKMPVNEVVKKGDIFYGDENNDDIQSQPYILYGRRMAVSNAQEFAGLYGVKDEDVRNITGDDDTYEQSGEDAKLEVNERVTLVYKFYRKNGTVHMDISTRYVDIVKGMDLGIALYPFAHFNWEDKPGNARGEGEVRGLIPNQIEVNKTVMRRVLTVRNQAYPYMVVDTDKISNPDDLKTVGSTIKTKGNTVEDVRKIIGTINPAQISPDAKGIQEELINVTRELAGAGDVATGQVNPETASGKAILAVQQASQAPMTEQREAFKNFIEDVARIWLEYLIVHSSRGIAMEEEVKDGAGNKITKLVTVPQSVLRALQATVKIDITPKSVFDKFAQEQTLENLFVKGMFNVQKYQELKVYVEALDDDSVAPKRKLIKILEHMEAEMNKIAQIKAKAQLAQQRFNQFISAAPEQQAMQIAEAERQLTGAA